MGDAAAPGTFAEKGWVPSSWLGSSSTATTSVLLHLNFTHLKDIIRSI